MSQLLWLPFWVAILISLWQFIGYMDDNPKPIEEHIYQMLGASAVMFLVAGVGALIKKPKIGAAVGVLAAFFAVLLMAPTIY